MTEIQNRLFLDLCKLRDILDNNGITYYLAYGTLLGAVRHQGFIPWDDDIDIYVKIKDIPHLRKVFEQESGSLRLHDYITHPDYPYSIPKIVDEKTILKERVFEHLDYECGVYIDIFPLIEIPDNPFWKCYLEVKRYCYYGLVRYYNRNQSRFGSLHRFIKRFINLRAVQRRMDNNLMSSHRRGKLLTEPLAFEERLKYPKQFFENTEVMSFEKELFKVPSLYKEYLGKTYGNYMQLPPEIERQPKHDFFFKILD